MTTLDGRMYDAERLGMEPATVRTADGSPLGPWRGAMPAPARTERRQKPRTLSGVMRMTVL